MTGVSIVVISRWAEPVSINPRELGQMALINSTLEEYKELHGHYPQASDGDYSGSRVSKILYQVLTGDGDDALGGSRPSNGRIDREEMHLEPRPPLDPAHDKHGLVQKREDGTIRHVLLDPLGNPWNYRPFDPKRPELTRNSTYDLWSFGLDKRLKNESKWTTNS